MRRTSWPCISGRTPADGLALLHERRGARVRARQIGEAQCFSGSRQPSRRRPRHCRVAPSACAVPEAHFVNKHPLEPPFPEGLERAMFGMGCFWGAERKFWQLRGVYSTAVGYTAGHTPNPTYREVCTGMTGHTEAVLVVFDPKRDSLRGSASGVLGEPQSHARHAAGQRRRHAVSFGIYYYDEAQRQAAEASRDAYQPRVDGGGTRPDHNRDSSRARVLLRRGISPAVSRQESRRLLRAWRNRRELSGGRCRHR